MAGSNDIPIQFTLNDIEVGSRLYEALVLHAREKQGMPIIYSDLLALARHLHPTDEVLGRAVPVGIGTKLLFVEAFCRTNGYPNLACLAVNKAKMKPGPGYKGDWEADKRDVATFDWAKADARLATYASETRAAVPKRRTRRTDKEAGTVWYEYFLANRAACAQITLVDKKEIVNLLMEGLDPSEAMGRVLGAKAEFGDHS